MNRHICAIHRLGLIAAGIVIGVGGSKTPAAEDAQAIVKTDQAFLKSVQAGDAKALAGMLDDKLEWTNTDGQTRSKGETVQNMKDFAVANGGEPSEVNAFNYGRLGYILGVQHNARFLRIWVKRPSGWKLFNDLETSIPPEATPFPSVTGDCVNPCRAIPFTPTTEVDKGILEAWQKAKNDEWQPNPDDWVLHVADEFLIINRNARGKVERVSLIAKQKEKGEAGPPGDPIVTMRMFDFGDASAVMLSRHNPYRGGKPYYNVRVWIKRDDRWQLAVSQQTVIQSAEPAPAASSSKGK
jgi:hypothetical protein